MFAALVVFLGSASFAKQSAVDFYDQGSPLSIVLPRLSHSCGISLKASKAISDDIVCIDVHGVPTDELLARIAQASGGKWLREGSVNVLVPDFASRNELTRKGVLIRKKRIEADFAHLFPKWISSPTNKSEGDDSSIESANAPDTLLFQVFNTIGAEAIAKVRQGVRVVYSTIPTGRQQQLSKDFHAEISAYLKAMNSGIEGRDSDAEHPENKSVHAVPKIAKLVAVVDRDELPPPFWISAVTIILYLYDENGQIVSHVATTLDFGDPVSGALPNGRDIRPDSGKQRRNADDFIELSPIADSLRTILNRGSVRNEPNAESEVRGLARSPEVADPLSYPCQILSWTAKRKNLQLVASLPDSFLTWFANSGSLMTANDVLASLTNDSDLATALDGSWLIVSPTDYSAEPVNRQLLAKLTTTFEGKIDFTIDDLFALARAGFGQRPVSDVVQPWVMLLCPALYGLEEMEDWPTVRVFAQMKPEVIATLANGSPIPLGAGGDDVQQLVDELIFSHSDLETSSSQPGTLMIDSSKAIASRGTDEIPAVQHDALDRDSFNYRVEPTEVAPRGVPPWALISVTIDHEAIIRPAGQASYSRDQLKDMPGLTPEELGSQAAVVIRNPNNDQNISSVDYDKEERRYKHVQVGIRTSLRVRFFASAESYRLETITLPTFTTKSLYTLRTLPADVQKEFDAAVVKAKQEARDQLTREN